MGAAARRRNSTTTPPPSVTGATLLPRLSLSPVSLRTPVYVCRSSEQKTDKAAGTPSRTYEHAPRRKTSRETLSNIILLNEGASFGIYFFSTRIHSQITLLLASPRNVGGPEVSPPQCFRPNRKRLSVISMGAIAPPLDRLSSLEYYSVNEEGTNNAKRRVPGQLSTRSFRCHRSRH